MNVMGNLIPDEIFACVEKGIIFLWMEALIPLWIDCNENLKNTQDSGNRNPLTLSIWTITDETTG